VFHQREQGAQSPAVTADDKPRTKQELEQIADLDWWSKFYISKDDVLKVGVSRSVVVQVHLVMYVVTGNHTNG